VTCEYPYIASVVGWVALVAAAAIVCLMMEIVWPAYSGLDDSYWLFIAIACGALSLGLVLIGGMFGIDMLCGWSP
jgi:hypothetical protein